jgi:hypothetical protein
MIKSLAMNCGVDTKKRVHIHCFDKESIDALQNVATVYQNYSLGDDLKEYQNWSFDPSSNFSKIVSWKWKIIKSFYDKNPEFIFTDTDIFFIKNTEDYLRSCNKNIVIQTDTPGSKYCTGFMYFKHSDESKKIVNACAMNHADDQLLFNRFVGELKIESKIHLLSSDLFPNGYYWYKTDGDKSKAYLVHNNHMMGIETKISNFKNNNMWLLETK